MIATRVIGCKACAKPAALVGDEVPLDGLCDACSKRRQTVVTSHAYSDSCVCMSCWATRRDERATHAARIRALEAAGDAMRERLYNLWSRTPAESERLVAAWDAAKKVGNP